MEWISIEDELPIQRMGIYVKNGKHIVWAYYYRKKWWSWQRRLHKVTHWNKCPVTYPKIPAKDMRAYLRRAAKYKKQMQKKNLVLPNHIYFGTYPPFLNI